MPRHASNLTARNRALITVALSLVACKGAERPRPPSAASLTLAVVHPDSAVRGVAGDASMIYAAFAASSTAGTDAGPSSTGAGPSGTGAGPSGTGAGPSSTDAGPSNTGAGPSSTGAGPSSTGAGPSSTGAGPSSVIEARRGSTVIWKTALGGSAGELASVGELVVASLSGRGTIATPTGNGAPAPTGNGAPAPAPAPTGVVTGSRAPITLRGEPGAIVAALDHATGLVRWRASVDSTQWALVTSIAAAGNNDILIGGSFGGTLRIGARVVSSAGGSDGFVARISPAGQIVWLVRLGGAGSDGVQGVAATRGRIAIAGTFSAGADLLGHPLVAVDEKSPYGDAFVAELDDKGVRRWSSTFGSRADDAVAGVAIDGRGRVVVAASARDVVRVGSVMLHAQGESDGLVVWYGADGEQGAAVLVGGPEADALRGISALGDHVAIAGVFSGTLRLGDHAITANGGDDAFVAALDGNGTVATSWHVGGAGREEITSLSAVPGGFIAGVAHTAAATVEDSKIAAPADPASGAALVVRGF